MKWGYLAVRQKPKVLRISFVPDSPPELNHAPDCDTRTSPVFAAAQHEATPPDFSGSTSILFLVFDRPYQVIARLRADCPELFRRTWFSHGLASVVILGAVAADVEPLRADSSLGFRAMEIWTLRDGNLEDSECVFAPPISTTPPGTSLQGFGSLDSDTQVLLEELQACLHTAIRIASQYAPRYLRILDCLTQAANEIITELTFLQAPTGPPPPSLPEGAFDSESSRSVELQRRLHQRVGQLVQINSALSYLISQALSGIFPLRESECQVRRYSLLGIGTAVHAIAAFAEFVERIFEKFPVDEAIDRLFDLGPPLPIWPLISSEFDPRAWSASRYHIDTFLKNTEPTTAQPRLVFFSGRLGFREAEFAVTAALQVLASADSVRWSLMTLSHELMHAHVRGVLSVLFDEPQKGASASFKDFHTALAEVVAGRSDGKNLRASLRLAILNYCTVQPFLGDIIRGRKSEESIALLSFQELRESLSLNFAAINHAFVHVFDFFYFYNARSAVYLRLLWESWATVPAVLEDLDEYLLRSIVTISTVEEGSTSDRFENALAILISALVDLSGTRHCAVASFALEHLSQHETKRRLIIRFTPAAYLAEVAAKVLVASPIHGALLRDDLAEPHEMGCQYYLESGEFAEVAIESPVAFLLDRLRRNLSAHPAPRKQEEYLSAWSLLVCASATPK
jgi:hypothetical protein